MLQVLFGRLSPDLAVDLGTANTLVSVAGRGLILNEPSVVAVDQETRRVLGKGAAVGHVARQMLGRTPESIAVVRPLANGVITDFRLCEAMLRYFLQKALGDGWHGRPRVLIAVPGSITPVEKQAVFNSAQRAGARQVYLVTEAKAAAIGAGLPINEPVANMICDIGGGTTEMAVISLGQIVASHSIRTGGDHMDQAIVTYLRRSYSLRISTSTAEHLKIAIGSAYPLPREVAEEVCGIDAASGLPRRATITSDEIREALFDPLEEIVDAIKVTLDGCSPDLASDLVDHGVVLAGGGSLMRGLDQYLAEQLGIAVRRAAEPLEAVVKGAQLCLENFSRWQESFESSDDVA